MEYIALSQAMRNVITFMALMKEVYFILNIHVANPEEFFKAFKYNQSCISVAKSKIISPRTKNIAIKHHHFQSFVQKKIIQICYINTGEQTMEIFTKAT